jgi:hypothetical protein
VPRSTGSQADSGKSPTRLIRNSIELWLTKIGCYRSNGGDTLTPRSETGHFHAVQFYNDDASLARIVAAFLAEGFATGDPAIVIATPVHRVALEASLRARSIDVDALKRKGDIVLLDARDALDSFMVDGMPHAETFRRVLGGVIEKVCGERPECTVRAYGEMVNLLWKDGLESAAIRLETLWNELANTHDFKLLCGYSMGNFYKGAAIEEIKRQHSHLVEETGATMTIQ